MLHGNLPAVYFYSARVRRSRGASWSSFSPALTADSAQKITASLQENFQPPDYVSLSWFRLSFRRASLAQMRWLRSGSASIFGQRILSPLEATSPNLTKRYEPVFTGLAVVKV